MRSRFGCCPQRRCCAAGSRTHSTRSTGRSLIAVPDTAEYHLHRANLLPSTGLGHGARRRLAEAFGQAAALDPSNPDAKRSQLTVYFDSGRFTEAARRRRRPDPRCAPENEEYAQAVLQVLNRRFETLDGDYVVLSRRCVATSPGTATALPDFSRVGYAKGASSTRSSVIRETRTRFGDSKLGYGWALLEPTAHILMLSLVFAVLMRGRPPIGEEFFIFYYTGIIPYHMFVHTSSSMTYAIWSNGVVRCSLPLVGTFDVLVARGLLELPDRYAGAAARILLVRASRALGLRRAARKILPASPTSLLVVWLLGCGCGLLNAVINAFVKSWDKIWAQLTRLLYFCSGIFLCAGNSAGVDPRHPGLKPLAVARGRLVLL